MLSLKLFVLFIYLNVLNITLGLFCLFFSYTLQAQTDSTQTEKHLQEYLTDFGKPFKSKYHFSFTSYDLKSNFDQLYKSARKAIPSLSKNFADEVGTEGDTIQWCFGMSYYIRTIGKWDRIESSISEKQKSKFFEDLQKLNFHLYLTNYSFHYLDLDENGEIDLYIYDCTDGSYPATYVFSYSDTLTWHREIPSYINKIKKIENGVKIITVPSYGPTVIEKSIETYTIKKQNNNLIITPELHIATWRGIEIDGSKPINKQFTASNSIVVGLKNQRWQTYPPSSTGRIIYETDKHFLVCMDNNIIPDDSLLHNLITFRMKENFRPYYTIGWMKKSNKIKINRQ